MLWSAYLLLVSYDQIMCQSWASVMSPSKLYYLKLEAGQQDHMTWFYFDTFIMYRGLRYITVSFYSGDFSYSSSILFYVKSPTVSFKVMLEIHQQIFRFLQRLVPLACSCIVLAFITIGKIKIVYIGAVPFSTYVLFTSTCFMGVFMHVLYLLYHWTLCNACVARICIKDVVSGHLGKVRNIWNCML